MCKNVQCLIKIAEVDGKLTIIADIPDNAEATVAGALTRALIEKSAEIMNEVLGENQRVEKIATA